MSGEDAGGRLVELGALRASMGRALEADGMSAAHAAETAEVLLDAELRGYDDHGVWFMGEVHKWLKSGALNPTPKITVGTMRATVRPPNASCTSTSTG